MDIFDGIYYKSCKVSLSSIGLWPYQTNMRRRISGVIFFIINISWLIPLISLLCKMWMKSFTVTFENSVTIMFAVGCCTKYAVTYSNSQKLNRLFQQIASDWQQITDTTDRSILMKYSADGKFLITCYQIYIWFGWIIYTWLPFTPYVLDALLPLNESRSLFMPFYGDYIFFDQAEYHYTSCFHLSFLGIFSAFMFCGVDSTFAMSVQHTCGLFAIICHRLDAPKKEIDNAHEEMKLLSVHELRKVIIFHKNCLTCSGLLEDSFNISFLIINSMSVVSLGLMAVYMIYIYKDIYKIVRVVTIYIGLINHLLFLNYVGQKIIDSSENVFLSAYCSKWYIISTSASAFIKMMMLRALEPCRLTAGKLSILCMESFGNLIKASVSYFTVFLSMA